MCDKAIFCVCISYIHMKLLLMVSQKAFYRQIFAVVCIMTDKNIKMSEQSIKPIYVLYIFILVSHYISLAMWYDIVLQTLL